MKLNIIYLKKEGYGKPLRYKSYFGVIEVKETPQYYKLADDSVKCIPGLYRTMIKKDLVNKLIKKQGSTLFLASTLGVKETKELWNEGVKEIIEEVRLEKDTLLKALSDCIYVHLG